MSSQDRPTVVTLTPLAAERDSRTLKIALSFARHGYRSIVVENRASSSPNLYPDIEIQTLSIFGRGRRKVAGFPENEVSGQARQMHTNVSRTSFLPEVLHYLRFVLFYHFLRPLINAREIPAAELYYLHEYRLYPLLKHVIKGINAPFIYDAHDFYPEVVARDDLSTFWRWIFFPLLQRMEYQCAQAAAEVVMVGDGVAQLFEERYKRKPMIIRNAYDRKMEIPPPLGIRDVIDIPSCSILVVVVGNQKPGLASSVMIESLASVPCSVHLAFIGRFHESTRIAACAANVEERVHCVGEVAPGSVVPFIRSGDLAAVPYEAATKNAENIMPNGFYHSIAAGLPVLYSPLPEISQTVGKAVIGRQIDPSSAASIAKGINWFLEKPDRIEKISQHVSKFAEEISWQQEEARLLKKTDALIAARSARNS